MKQRISYYTLFAAAVLLCATGCSKEDTENNPGCTPDVPATGTGVTVQFSAGLGPDTRTAHTPDGKTPEGFVVTWIGTDTEPDNYDRVGICVGKVYNYNNPLAGARNVAYRPTQSAATSPLEAVSLAAEGYEAGKTYSFFSYYPYDDNQYSNLGGVDVPDLTRQTQAAPDDYTHLRTYDFLVARQADVTMESGSDPVPVNFRYEHVFTSLQFCITNGRSETVRINKITLSKQDGSGMKYVLQYSFNGLASSTKTGFLQLAVTSPADLSANSTQKFWMMLYPASIEGATELKLSVYLSDNDGNYVYTLKKVVPAGGFEAGYNYTLEMDVKDTGLSADESWANAISNVDQLKAFRDRVNNGTTYKGQTVQIADGVTTLDLNNEEWTPIGIDFNNGKRFEGTFDGRGVTVKNMKVSSPPATAYGSTYGGFFGGADGTIKNLIVEGTVEISAGTNSISAGGICGYIPLGKIEFCRFSGTVSSTSQSTDTYPNNYAGGIAGQYPNLLCCISDATVTQSISQGNATYTGAGGLLGKGANSGSVTYSAWNSHKTTDMIGQTTPPTTTGTNSFTDINGLNGLLEAMNNGSPDSEFIWQAAPDGGSPVLVKRASPAN